MPQKVVTPRVIRRTECLFCGTPLKTLEKQLRASMCVECEKAHARGPMAVQERMWKLRGLDKPKAMGVQPGEDVFRGFREGDD